MGSFNFKNPLRLFWLLFVGSILLTGINALSSYKETGTPIISKTCVMELRHPGGEVREDYDKLQKLFISGMGGKDYDMVSQMEFFTEGELPLLGREQSSDPRKFLAGTITATFNGWSSIEERYCPAGKTAVGTSVALDLRSPGILRPHIYSYFKDSKPAFEAFIGFECLNNGYSKTEWEKARSLSIAKLTQQIPSCESFWMASKSLISVPFIDFKDWRNPPTQVIATCKSTDFLDPISIEIHTFSKVVDSSSLSAVVMANGEVVATNASIPEVLLRSTPYLKPSNFHLYMPFGYQAKNPDKDRSISGFFLTEISKSVHSSFDEQSSGSWPGEFRKRQIQCAFDTSLITLK